MLLSKNNPSLNINSYINIKSKDHAKALGLLSNAPDRALWKVAGYLKRGGASREMVSNLLGLLNDYPPNPVPPNIIAERITKAYAKDSSDELGLTEMIRDWVRQQTGNFATTDVNKELGLTTRDNTKKVTVVLGRLVNEGIIERYGDKRGHFRIVERSTIDIDWQNAEVGGGLPVYWPLDLHERFETMPGSIIMVAGESNAGKTAWMLATVQLNLGENWPRIDYFASSNEVNERTLKKRITAFGLPDESWAGFKPQRPKGDFCDAIDPNGFNLIDYLEVHQDFYEIGGKIAAIAAKLKDGIAVIAIQKNPGSVFGRGGAMTMEKASAYISLNRGDYEKNEPHKLKLPKIKYPLVDYASKEIRFKLVQGHKFVNADKTF